MFSLTLASWPPTVTGYTGGRLPMKRGHCCWRISVRDWAGPRPGLGVTQILLGSVPTFCFLLDSNREYRGGSQISDCLQPAQSHSILYSRINRRSFNRLIVRILDAGYCWVIVQLIYKFDRSVTCVLCRGLFFHYRGAFGFQCQFWGNFNVFFTNTGWFYRITVLFNLWMWRLWNCQHWHSFESLL